MTDKISEKEFVLRAIDKLRGKNPDGTPKYKGIHVVYSGFNSAFREYFQKDPVPVVRRLEMEGEVVTKPVKGGVMIYKAGDEAKESSPQEVIDKILEN